MYSSRLGEIKLNPWRDGIYNLAFLVKKRFGRRNARPSCWRKSVSPVEPASLV